MTLKQWKKKRKIMSDLDIKKECHKLIKMTGGVAEAKEWLKKALVYCKE